MKRKVLSPESLKRKKNFLKTVITCVLICCLCFSGCGADKPDPNQEIKNNEAVGGGTEPTQPTSPNPTNQLTQTNQPSQINPEDMHPVPMPEQYVPEGREIVTLGTFGKVYSTSPMYKAVELFNQAQEKYFVQIEIYYNLERFLIDIVRKQGTDLYNLYWGVSADDLAQKGVLEDLTPYFESSAVVSREDIVDAVWRAGSVDDKLYFLIPCFQCAGILVEKGYTKEGAWSGKDYIELGKKYPGSMLSKQIQDPSAQYLSELKEYMAAFINYEDRTCSFGGDEFIALLEDLKALSSYNYEAVDKSATMADLIRGKFYLTKLVTVGMDSGMYRYRDIIDAFGDSYDIAGMPTADGSLKYGMDYYDQMYGMNAASKNKEGAWAFLEYLLSEEYQQPEPPSINQGYKSPLGSQFPVRKDALERGLQANIDYVTDPNERIHYNINEYTKEKTAEGFEGFTEEDKQAVLHIIDNSYRPIFERDYTLLNILSEETEPFFQGHKSAAEVAKIIQSRVNLYLIE